VRKLRNWISQHRRRLGMPAASWDPAQAGAAAADASKAGKQRKAGKEQTATSAASQATQLLSRQNSTKASAAAPAAGPSIGGDLQQMALELPNLVMTSAFKFDKQAILRCLV
jgi:hypothetical protein